MKATLLKSVMCVALVFAGVFNSNVMAQEKFYTNDVMNGEQLTSKIVYRYDGQLYHHMKHDFAYDEQNRIVEKETFKWDSVKETWMPYVKISLSYTSDQIAMNYAKWDAKEQNYSEVQERNIYELDGVNTPITYQHYKWNKYREEWKKINDIRLTSAPVLLAEKK